MTDRPPLVDCCGVDEADRTFRPGFSPYALDPDPLKRPMSRRRVLRQATVLASAAAAATVVTGACGGGGGSDKSSAAEGETRTASTKPKAAKKLESLDLPYCSQILCGVPLETAVKRGFFEDEGLEVKLVYMKGGALTVQSLLASSVDFVGAAMDVVISAAATGKEPVMVASLSSLPFFALVTAPGSTIKSVADLKGKTIGVANLNTSDHLLARHLLEKNGIDDASASFAPFGPNLFDGLRTGRVDAGLVQEPALTLLQQKGSAVLVNFMKRADADKYLGGPYQFFGLNTRRSVIGEAPETLHKLINALTEANNWIRSNPGSEIVKVLPAEFVKTDDLGLVAASLDNVKNDLYPAELDIDRASVERVIEVQKAAGVLQGEVTADQVFTNELIGA